MASPSGTPRADGIPAAAPILDGEPSAELVIGEPMALLDASEAGMIRLNDYVWLVADGLERLAELPGDILRRLQGELLRSWERRSILVCEKLTMKAKNLAWDLADNPSEIRIEEEAAKAQSVVRETWNMTVEDKPRFLLGLIEREKPKRICVFCNLGSTAEEIARRLEVNGLSSEHLSDSLASDRARHLLEKVNSGECFALVLTDSGAQSFASDPFNGPFSLVVNYDIPLEPDFFVKRLGMLDRSDVSAKVVSMVCDRYVYGLTAVEHYIEAKLDARPIDPSLLAARDLSEGMVFGRPQDPDRQRLDVIRDRRTRNRDEKAKRNDARNRDPGGLSVGRFRDIYPRDDRSPDIRRSIAEATGGSIDMRETGTKRPALPQGGRQNPRGAASNGGTREGKRIGQSREAMAPGNGRPLRRPPAGEAVANPYDLPIEERMRRYREKYGRRIEGKNADRSRTAPERDGKASSAREAARSGGPRGNASNVMGPQGKKCKSGQAETRRGQKSPREANRAQPSHGPSLLDSPERTLPGPDGKAPKKEPASSGLLRRIRDAFRKRDE